MDISAKYSQSPFTQQVVRIFDATNQWNTKYTICFLLHGQLALTHSNKQYILRANDICFFAPYEMYSFVALENNSHLLMLQIDANYLFQYFSTDNPLYFSECIIPYNMSNTLYYELCIEFSKLTYYSINVSHTSTLKMISAVTNILSYIINAFGSEKKDANEIADYTQQRIMNTLSYINKNYANKITLSDISNHIGIHPQYFSSFFKKEFHINFVDYLNSFRVTKSIPLLLNPAYSITDIAQQCGFGDHKAYGLAFKKVHSLPPTLFRKNYSQFFYDSSILPSPNHSIHDIDDNQNYFSFFQKFWSNKGNVSATNINDEQIQLMFSSNLQKPQKPIGQNRQLRIDFIGRASSCLRSDVQNYIIMAKKELQFDYLRIRDIFSDDLYVYHENLSKESLYNWNHIDLILDFFVTHHIKPMIEIGFMPKELASKNQTSVWQYHPNVSHPKSLSKWSNLVSSFIEHCIDRYGIYCVREWLFDFWTSPNLKLNQAYWYESQEDFFKFYKTTWFAIKNIDSDLSFGTPTFSLPGGLDWYESFFEFCKNNHIQPDYISIHSYNCSDSLPNDSIDALHPNSLSEAFSVMYSKNYPLEIFKLIKEMNHRCFPIELPVYSTSWSISYFPNDYTRDTCFMAPYLIYTSLHSFNLIDGLCYWSLCDINDEIYPDTQVFSGNTGMIDPLGIKKSSYYGLKLLRKLGKTILEQDEYHTLTRSEKGYQLIIYNYSFYDESLFSDVQPSISYTDRYNFFKRNGTLIYHHSLALPAGNYYIRRTEINKNHGSSYDIWVENGSPARLDSETIEYIQCSSVPKITTESIEITNNYIIDTIIPDFGVVLYEITKQINSF